MCCQGRKQKNLLNRKEVKINKKNVSHTVKETSVGLKQCYIKRKKNRTDVP